MSSYIVDDSTINNIVATIRNDQQLRRELAEGRPDICLCGTCDPGNREYWQALGEAMFKLNVKAVTFRYGDAGELVEYKFSTVFPLPAVQAYKSLRCWLYQCLEGDVPKDSLYCAMNAVSNQMARSIVANLSEYDQADWG